ncbi:MAG: alkaline phosphatase family protein, partial [Vulcanimicrobiaceae bacterium]
LIAAQTGETQAARHPEQAIAADDEGPGEPVVDDLEPAFGPYQLGSKPATTQYDQTYANLLLTLGGSTAPQRATADLDDIRDDLAELGRSGGAAVPWGWYQEGFARAGSDPDYSSHHNAPQFFGYVRNSPALWSGEHDLGELLPAIRDGKLGERGVVFVKGGTHTPFGWKPANPDPEVQAHFLGDDDHPGYSDSQLSEALVATVVNAVARSRYWDDSAIIVTYDDSEGFYDHVPPPVQGTCPDGRPCGDGPRVPFILISPYARSHAIVSEVDDHASFAKFLDLLFGLEPLASLPDERPYLPAGPRDTSAAIGDLSAGFDPERLAGTRAPIPAQAALISDAIVDTFPPTMSCASLGITPVAVPGELSAPPPGFAPRTVARSTR